MAPGKGKPPSGNSTADPAGVAIIGMAGRFPGAHDMDALWTVLQGDAPVTGPVPADRAALRPWADRWQIAAGFLDDIDRFDPGFFNISPKDAAAMDPQQRLLLQVVWQTIENAGLNPQHLPRETGVFAGVISGDYGTFAEDMAQHGDLPLRATDHYQVANRISYHFDLTGPSLAIDTACSGSGVAIHQAIRALESGDCPLAIVAGVNLFLHASRFAQFRQLGIISPDNTCRPFRDGANGTVYGEGVAALLLCPAAAAKAEGHNVRAYIRGSAVNSGGHTQGFTVPSAKAQGAALKTALARAGGDMRDIAYIEAHGTGTKLGDPIEIRGLVDALTAQAGSPRTDRITLGSIKGHIGHLESAAALAGIAKIVLQMEHGALVPSLPVGPTNPLINFAKTPFVMADAQTAWPAPPPRKGGTRRALLSSFGAGGVNACLVLEAAEPADTARDTAAPCAGLFPFSARDPDALTRMAQAHVAWLDGAGADVPPARLAATLQVGRAAFHHRLVVIAPDLAGLRDGLVAYLAGTSSAHVMTGSRVDALDRAFGPAAPGAQVALDLLRQGAVAQLAALWVNGVDVDWAQDAPRRTLPRPVPAPGYPFRGDRYWLPARKDTVAAPQDTATPLTFPGRRITLAQDGADVFTLRLDDTVMPSIAQHRIFDDTVVPGSFFVALAASAAWQTLGRFGFDLTDATFREGLILHPGTPQEVQCLISAPDAGDRADRHVQIASRCVGGPPDWRIHFQATLTPDAAGPIPQVRSLGASATSETTDAFYDRGRALGFGWSGPYRALSDIRRSDTGAEARVSDIGQHAQEAASAVVHPATLDAIFQVALAALQTTATRTGEAFMPLGLRRFRVLGAASGPINARFAPGAAPGDQSERFDGIATTADDRPLFAIEGLTVLRVAAANLHALRQRSTRRQVAGPEILIPAWHPLGARGVAALPVHARLAVLPSGDTATLRPLLALDAIDVVDPAANQMPQIVNLVHAAQTSGGSTAQLASAAAGIAHTLRDLSHRFPATALRCWLIGTDGLDHAALSGFWRSLRWEMPGLRPATVLLGAALDADAAHKIATLLHADPVDDAWRLGSAEWDVARLTAITVKAGQALPTINGTNAVVAGGAGGLGRLHVDWLLRRGAAQVLVLGRTPTQGGALPATLAPLAQAHGPDRIIYRAVDLADAAAVAAALGDLPQPDMPLSMVFHCAGTSAEAGLLSLTETDVRDALSPKLDGLHALMRAVQPFAPARIIALSSATGLLGAPGQTAYAMANAGLDALCADLRQTGMPVSSVAWGPWAGTGMTARIAGTASARATSGAAGGFDADQADTLFDQVYAQDAGRSVAMPQGWRSYARHLGDGPLPSLWRSATDDAVPVRPATAVTPPRSTDARAVITAAMKDVLGYPDADAFDWHASFRDLGADSVSAVKLRDQVGQATGLALSATIIFDHTTPDRLSRHLADLVAGGPVIDATPPAIPQPRPPARPAPYLPVQDLDDAAAEQALAQELRDLGLLSSEVAQ